MFGKLFGSTHTAPILIFLLINERGYPTQIAKHLQLPLTPIQNALSKLEKEGLVYSEYEGKNRRYALSPTHPLAREFEALLRKAFSLYPAAEKKKYFSLLPPPWEPSSIDSQGILSRFWKALQHIRTVRYIAGERMGFGTVSIERPSPYTLIFEEEGKWEKGLNFHNTFQWHIDPQKEVLSLEHLRRGRNHPTFLFHLIPVSNHFLESIDTHLHGEETYYGYVEEKPPGLKLHYRALTPHKFEEYTYLYSTLSRSFF